MVKFNYIQFNGVATILNRLKNRFPNAEHYIFKETNISHLGQLNALAEVQGLNSIQIEAEGNPIISKNWKLYAVFRLAHWGLKLINGKEVNAHFLSCLHLSNFYKISNNEEIKKYFFQRLFKRVQTSNVRYLKNFNRVIFSHVVLKYFKNVLYKMLLLV